MSRNADRVAEELRILRAAKDGRLRMNTQGRWIVQGIGEARPDRKARERLETSMRIQWTPAGRYTITDKGRAMLADHQGSSA